MAVDQRRQGKPGGHGLIVRAPAEEIDHGGAGVDEGHHRLLVGVRCGRGHALPLSPVQRGDPVGETAPIHVRKDDHRLEGLEHPADLVDVDPAVRLDGEARALDRGKGAAPRVGIEIACALECGENRPHDPRRLGGDLARDARDELAAIKHAQPLDRAQLRGAFDECRDFGVVRSVRRGCPSGRRLHKPAARRTSDGLDRPVDGAPHTVARQMRLDFAERGKRNHRFERRPELGDLLRAQLAHGAEHPAAVDCGAHR